MARTIHRRHLVKTAVAASVLTALIVPLAVRLHGRPVTGGASAAAPAEPTGSTAMVEPAAIPATPLHISIDPTLATPAPVPGLQPGDPPRPSGRMVHDDLTIDVVLDELVVSVASDAELAAVLERWGGVVLDTAPVEPGDELADYLIRIDPTRAAGATPDQVAADLSALDTQSGELRVGSEPTLRLLAALGAEGGRHGTAIHLNTVVESSGIAEGEAHESEDFTKNVFDWSYIASGTAQDFGVDAAWQLMLTHDRLRPDNRVRVMVNDGGFSPNWDFPEASKIRQAKWSDENPVTCSGGSSCPFHGTHVVLTLMGQLDNGYGTAGPAAPVADLVAVQLKKDDWSRLKNLEQMVDDERPTIVNMSYGGPTTVDRSGVERRHDRRYKHMVDRGALLVAAAGNEGRDVDTSTCVGNSCSENVLWFPCESKWVLCVGGLASDSIARDSDSNYGQADNNKSVELWGPYTVRSINDPNRTALDFTTKSVGGTSFSSPFVAGIAALVKAADPSLGPEEITRILHDTANVGVQGTWIQASQRRVNARAAVAKALGVKITAPAVEITKPDDGDTISAVEWPQLAGRAVAFTGLELPISWESSIDGPLTDKPQFGVVSLTHPLSIGTHVITASATDLLGVQGHAEITITVPATPPKVAVVSPSKDTVVYDGDGLRLIGVAVDGDTYLKLADGDVHWEVRPSGQAKPSYTADGHDVDVPPASLPAGSYEITLTGTAPGGTATDTVTVTVKALPPGARPTATMIAPTADTELGVPSGGSASLRLRGRATDPDDGTLPGTHLKWIARAGGTTKVLCAGSAVSAAASPTGSLQTIKDCSDVTVPLPLPPGAPANDTWAIELQAVDSTGLFSKPVTVEVLVHAAVG